MSQTIMRVEKKTNYVVLNKDALNDPNLSWKAKGLLAYLLSLPDNWKIYIEELQNHSKDGRDSTTAALKELMKAGYIQRVQLRGNRGKFGEYQYVVYEYSKSIENADVPPKTGFPKTVKPNTDNPKTENPQLLNNNNTKYKEEETIKGEAEEVVMKYQECISKNISEYEIEILLRLQRSTCKEIVIKAIEVAVIKNGKNLGYISTLVNDWKGKGFKNSADIDKHLAEWATKNQKAKDNKEKQVERRAEDKDYDKKSTFTGYEQRSYDFDELEKKMYGWNNQ